jgi:hypothetical protein
MENYQYSNRGIIQKMTLNEASDDREPIGASPAERLMMMCGRHLLLLALRHLKLASTIFRLLTSFFKLDCLRSALIS